MCIRDRAMQQRYDGAAAEEGTEEEHGSKQQKTRRAAEFVDWLIQTYSAEALNQGTGVLDVAGGKGAISFALTMKDIQSTLVDPGARKRLTSKSQARELRKSGRVAHQHIASCFDELFCADSATRPLIEGASLVLGMHPDEATEPIVDQALLHNKKFAVVPCCVFAHLSPDRMLADGTRVRDVNDFCAYLKEKDGRICEMLLPFEGRNKVLYIP
eukprot:TRINITY_DN19602_c0_g1_i2.p1 TRINITY_DN19602_c0_g1~~TRINITY_DN19602_c0_g1_i2.p1  ORF type:complete len:214 (+),score=51.23 TRINITY_DN19602_c0_g1_i2:117-758(+)